MIIHLDRDLKQRKKIDNLSKHGVGDGSPEDKHADETKPTAVRSNDAQVLVIGMIIVFTIAFLPFTVVYQAIDAVRTFGASVSKFVDFDDEGLKGRIGDDVRVLFVLKKTSEKDAYTLGPHVSKVTILKSDCRHPRILLRLKGEALVFIPLEQSGATWSADFYLPVAGQYKVDARWYGCDNFNQNAPTAYTSLSVPLSFSVVDSSSESPPLLVESRTPLKIFPIGFWQSKQTLITSTRDSIKSDYVWISMDKRNASISTFYNASSALGQASLVMEGYPVSSSGLLALTNYEVVCWVGSQTSELSRETFLSLRGQLAPRQRPFKFHYNKIDDLGNPEVSMNDRRMSRKCKQTWVMMDELEVSQAEFKKQVLHFLKEIESCMHDPTWSIWMFTVNSVNNPRACHSPATRTTSHHPCNDALFEIFDSNVLPANVRLVDNTDISNAQMGENPKDVAATIAMRIAALIGQQVDTWRAAGQHARRAGLDRNGVIEEDEALDCHFSSPG